MVLPSASAPPKPAVPSTPRFAFPARLVVVCVFMTQFMALLLGLGGLVPYLHQKGMHPVVLGLGAFGGYALLQLLLGLALRYLPVRCRPCRGRSHFAGFGWWPFIYRFTCADCGGTLRVEVGAR